MAFSYDSKYIKTKDGKIIVFSAALKHAQFEHFKPVSAGFVNFYINDDGGVSCRCYGESATLGLKANEMDTRLANFQIVNYH